MWKDVAYLGGFGEPRREAAIAPGASVLRKPLARAQIPVALRINSTGLAQKPAGRHRAGTKSSGNDFSYPLRITGGVRHPLFKAVRNVEPAKSAHVGFGRSHSMSFALTHPVLRHRMGRWTSTCGCAGEIRVRHVVGT